MNHVGAFPWEEDAGAEEQPAVDNEQQYATPDSPAADAADPQVDAFDAAQGAVQDDPAASAEATTAATETAATDAAAPAPRSRTIARREYYSIGEVSELVGLPAHVLRYWESQFPVLNPSKNRSGNRAYQRKEIRLILLVKQLLYEDKYTVEGAKTRLEQLRKGGELATRAADALDREALALLRQDVSALREVLAGSGD